jgi:hypothetical protein
MERTQRWSNPWLVERTLLKKGADDTGKGKSEDVVRIAVRGRGTEVYQGTYRPRTGAFDRLADSRGSFRYMNPTDGTFFAAEQYPEGLEFICDTPVLPSARCSRYRILSFGRDNPRIYEEVVRFREKHVEIELATATPGDGSIRVLFWWRYGAPQWCRAVYIVNGTAKLEARLTSLPPGALSENPNRPTGPPEWGTGPPGF